MKSLFGGLLTVTGAVALTVGVLTAVEILLHNPNRRRLISVPAAPESLSTPTPAQANVLVPKADSEKNFSIKRTKSEVGYVYWILEGYGKYKCFVLCDTWDEAVAQAKTKLAEVESGMAINSVPALA